MLVVGMTGGIGSGKSTVAGFFREHGAPVIDTDQISRELVGPDSTAFAQIVDAFGRGILNARGEIDRPRLRSMVFADPDARHRLEAILHPRIRQETERRIRALQAPYCIVSVPLLLESGWSDLVDRILVVDAPRELQIRRVMQRDEVTREEAESALAAQISRRERLDAADDVIVNEGNMSDLRTQVENLHERYSRRG